MVLSPAANWLPEMVMVPTATPPAPPTLLDPSVLLPSLNVAEPVGGALPLAATTLAVSREMEVLLGVTLSGLAVTVVVVEMVGTLTGTVTDPEEAP